MKRISIGLIAISVLISLQCKKKKSPAEEEPMETMPVPVIYPSYSPKKTGSYWIYETYALDGENAQSTHEYDSVYVEKDTLVGKYTYLKIHKRDVLNPKSNYILQRDSLHYIVSPGGIVVFSSEDFKTIFNTSFIINFNVSGDTMVKITKQMADRDKIFSTPAGDFVTSAMKTVQFIYPKYLAPDVTNPRNLYVRFCRDIGVISESYLAFLSSNTIYERRLIRYHIEK